MTATMRRASRRRPVAAERPTRSGSAATGHPQFRVLIVEDSPGDAEVVAHRLRAGGMEVDARRVEQETEFREALEHFAPDVVLCDYALPKFSGPAAIRIVQQEYPHVPCILVSGTIGEEATVEILKLGAQDFVLKSNLVRLAPAVRRALERSAAQHELERLQRELAENEARFRSLTELSSDWYWEVDAEHRFTGLSGTYLLKSGISPAENIGKRRWEIPDYDLTQQEWSVFRTVVEARKPFRDLEIRRVTSDGVRYMAISGEPVFDAHGAFNGYRGVGRDITERRLAEDSLLRFRAALDAALDAVYITDPRTLRILDVNKTASEATGYSREELLSMTIDGILTSFSRPEIQSAYSKAIDIAPEPMTFEARNRRRDGSEYPVEVHRRAVRTDDGHLMVGIARDITQRKATQEALRRLHAAVSVIADSLYIVDARTHRIVDVNATACQATGYTREELLGLPTEELFVGATPDRISAEYREVFDRMPHPVRFEARHRRRDGSDFPVEVQRSALRTEGGELIVGIARDISSHLQALAEIKARTAQQSAVAVFGQYALSARSLADVMARAVGEAAHLLRADFVRVLEHRSQDRALVLRGAHGLPQSAVGSLQVADGPATHAGYTLDATQPVLLSDLRSETRFEAQPLRELGIVSGVSVVIPGHGQPYGVLDAHCLVKREFSDDDVNFLTSIANVLAAAIERRRSEEVLRLRNRAIEASVNAVIITDARRPDHAIEYVNPAFERITGFAAAEAIGRNCRFLQGDDTEQQGLEGIRAALRNREEGHAVIRNYRKDGRMFWNELFIAPVRDDVGEVTHYIGIQTDVTEARQYQEQLEHKATHDELTGLPNRNLLRDRFRQAVSFAARHDQTVAVAFLDLDHFKFINDSLGHTAGDQVLRTIARRLTSFLREGDTVARVGGDEFVLVLSSPLGGDRMPEVIRRILNSIAEPLAMENREFQISSSIGISVSPGDGTDFDTLLKNADIAMYRAKEQGRNTFAFFSSDMNRQISERMSLESYLRRALGRQEFHLHYQPRVHLPSGRITGAEALIRWEQPELGDISPSRFIPLAEDLGLIDVIGNWVLHSACRQAQAWSEAGLPPIVVAVNLSVRQLLQDDIVEQVEVALRETGLDPRRLELEITESAMMREPQRTGRALAALHDLGISTAIDDFGTAYSSLNYLKHFKIDCLKIDQSFVRGLPMDKDDAGITRAIVAMGRSLNLRLIAEGIERDEQHAFLEAIGCEEGQGYLFSKAVAPDEMARLLAIGTLRGESTA